MSGKISNAWSLMGASWQVLKEDKKLLFFPLISGICLLLVQLSFFLPAYHYLNLHQVAGQHPVVMDPDTARLNTLRDYGLLFAYYYCSYAVITFFNAGLIACILRKLGGEAASFSYGLNEAMKRLPLIAGWALIASSIGLILRIIEDRSKIVCSIVAAVLGMVFSIASYFVIPIMVAENKGPIDALKESSSLFRKTWGERFVNNLGFSLIFFFLFLLGMAFIGVVIIGIEAISPASKQSVVLIVVCGVIGVLYFVGLSLAMSTIQSIFQTALYLYAKNGNAPAGFDQVAMGQSFKAKS